MSLEHHFSFIRVHYDRQSAIIEYITEPGIARLRVMNNTQFRRLVLDTPTAPKSRENPSGSKLHSGGATPALGSRMRSNIPMTPYLNPTFRSPAIHRFRIEKLTLYQALCDRLI